MSLKNLQRLAGVEPDGAFGKGSFKACAAFIGIKNHARAVHFFAQTGHETGNVTSFTENLNYSVKGLRDTFPAYFKTQQLAETDARHPVRIASRVYANRMGNGDENSADGWRFRGRGALQLTGKDNYQAFANFLNNQEVMYNPDIVSTRYSFESALFFFEKNKLWPICEQGFTDATTEKLTKKINGGLKGFDHRKELTLKYKAYAI